MNTHTHTHTPGPWSVETKGSRHFIDGADELTVAYVDRAGVRERQTYKANAHLIASAPDLLEALKALSVAVRDAGKEGTAGNLARAEGQALFAISKAEGRA